MTAKIADADRCVFIKSDGTRCQLKAMSGTHYCHVHLNKAKAGNMVELERKKECLDNESIKVSDTGDILSVLARQIELLAVAKSATDARALAYAASIWLKVYELHGKLERSRISGKPAIIQVDTVVLDKDSPAAGLEPDKI